MALPPPLDSGGGGKQRVGAQSNGGGSFKPRGGKREASERQAERSVALWTEQSGAQVPLRRAPHSAPTSPASLCPPAGTPRGGWRFDLGLIPATPPPSGHTTTRQTHLNPPPGTAA